MRPRPGRPSLGLALRLGVGLAVLASSGCAGCDSSSQASTPDAAASPAPTSSSSSAAPPASGSSTAAPAKVPLQILKLTLTSAVKDKEPVDRLEGAEPGQRVYAHLAVRNRSDAERVVHVVFKVNGDKRSSVDLEIQPSWSFRTWAYNTVLPTDTKGDLGLEVLDDAGQTLVEAHLPIRPRAAKKPGSP